MKKVSKNRVDREVRYVAFKSYRLKPPVPKINKEVVEEENTEKPKTINKDSSISVPVSNYKGDNVEQSALKESIDRIRKQEIEFKHALTNLQLENESLKRSLNASIPFEDHEKMKIQLKQSEDQCGKLELQYRDMEEIKEELSNKVQQLQVEIDELSRENAEFTDRIELEVDKINYLNESNETKATRIKELETQVTNLETHTADLEREVNELTTKNTEFSDRNKELLNVLDEIRVRAEDQNRRMENYRNTKKKLKDIEFEFQKVIEAKEGNSKLMQLLENDNRELFKNNESLTEQNIRLSKELTEMKKKMEQLRRKFDEINKVNKGLREKETRCLLHERINIGKCLRLPSTVPVKNDSTDIPSSSRCPYNSAKTQKRDKVKDSVYNLLHRIEGEVEHLNVKSKTRKG
ncbi:hypothetical protein PGB90_002500 [Kerria lacca]